MRDLLLVLEIHMVHQSREICIMMFLLRKREINPFEKFQDSAGIRTQDLPNTSQMPLPLSHLDPWQRSTRQAT